MALASWLEILQFLHALASALLPPPLPCQVTLLWHALRSPGTCLDVVIMASIRTTKALSEAQVHDGLPWDLAFPGLSHAHPPDRNPGGWWEMAWGPRI